MTAISGNPSTYNTTSIKVLMKTQESTHTHSSSIVEQYQSASNLSHISVDNTGDCKGNSQLKLKLCGEKNSLTRQDDLCDDLDLMAQEPWPDDVKMYQPYEIEQILLPDNASCLAVQAFLKMCNLPYEVVMRGNAEFMSPSGRVPFIRCGAFVVPELEPIVQFCAKKGASLTEKLTPDQKTDMRAYMSMINNVLVNAELYVTWLDEETFAQVTCPRNGSVYPWPLGWLQNRSKRATVTKRLKALKWAGKSLDEVLFDVERCCQALSERLDKKDYFYGSSPTELDALVFGHVMSILSITHPEHSVLISMAVRKYCTLVNLMRRVAARYFPHVDLKPLSVDAAEKTNELGTIDLKADSEMFGFKPFAAKKVVVLRSTKTPQSIPSPKKTFFEFSNELSKHFLGLNMFSSKKIKPEKLNNPAVEVVLEEVIERALWKTASIQVLQRPTNLKNNSSDSLTVARPEKLREVTSTSKISKFFLLMAEKSKEVMENLQCLVGARQSSGQLSIEDNPPLKYDSTEQFGDYYMAISSSESCLDLPEYKLSSIEELEQPKPSLYSDILILPIESRLLRIKKTMDDVESKISSLEKVLLNEAHDSEIELSVNKLSNTNSSNNSTLVPNNDQSLILETSMLFDASFTSPHCNDLSIGYESALESTSQDFFKKRSEDVISIEHIEVSPSSCTDLNSHDILMLENQGFSVLATDHSNKPIIANCDSPDLFRSINSTPCNSDTSLNYQSVLDSIH